MVIQWFRLAPDRTYQVFAVYSGIRNILIGLLIWLLFISGISWKARFKGLFGAVAVFALFFFLVRVESFDGDMVPHFQFRFSPTIEQRAEKYFQDARSSSAETESLTESVLEVSSEDWPAFRGAERDGVVRDQKIRTNWDEKPPRLLWKHPVGAGWGSFSIVGDYAYTQEQRGLEETLVCYDVLTGNQIWSYHDAARFTEILGGPGPRATPTFHAGLVYSMGATGILNCLNAVTGALVWSRNILEEGDLKNLQWAMSGSPLIWEDFVIVNLGHPQDTSELSCQSVIAFDRLTGKEVWSSGTRKSSYSSPQISVLNGRPELLIFHSKGVESFSPNEGKSLWFFPWTNHAGVNAAQPIEVGTSSVFIGAGYGSGSARITINHSDTGTNPKVVTDWQSKKLKLKFNSAVKSDGFVYGLDEGILTCLDLETGNRAWKKGRYGYGQLILVDGYLLIQAEDGRVELIKADPNAYSQIASFQAIAGKTWNHPALARGKLFVRNSEEAACYDVSPLSD